MIYKLLFLLFSLNLLRADYRLADLVLIATSPEEALNVAALIPEAQITPAAKNKIKTVFRLPSIGDAVQKINTARAQLSGSGTAVATGCLTKEEAQKIVGAPLPDIANAAAAKAELVKFFDAGNTGGKLLTEIGATQQQVDAVRNSISSITVKS